MTLASLFMDVMVICLLLIGGFIIRSYCKPLQKLFLPAPVVGGVLGLILGESGAGPYYHPGKLPGF